MNFPIGKTFGQEGEWGAAILTLPPRPEECLLTHGGITPTFVLFFDVLERPSRETKLSSLGSDPYLGLNNTDPLLGYWREVAFGEKSKTSIADLRKDLLERLLPMTKIAKQCKLEGNYLHVAGKIRSYKVNLGSGNILMEPNDQYLCIVQDSDPKVEKQIWLPFEGGDHILTIILSKAFFLADDDKITDSQILGQMSRGRG